MYINAHYIYIRRFYDTSHEPPNVWPFLRRIEQFEADTEAVGNNIERRLDGSTSFTNRWKYTFFSSPSSLQQRGKENSKVSQ